MTAPSRGPERKKTRSILDLAGSIKPSKSRLLDCPFCGAACEYFTIYGMRGHYWGVRCKAFTCGAESKFGADTKREAREWWNRRALMDNFHALADAIERGER